MGPRDAVLIRLVVQERALIDRYTRPAMGRIWAEENKYRCWLQVESAASAVLAEYGVIPADAADAISTQLILGTYEKASVRRCLEGDSCQRT